jgi:hypothetical protein
MAAGGMGRRRGPTLAERSTAARVGGDQVADGVGRGQDPDEPFPPGPGPHERSGDAGRQGPRRRHCWVAGGDGSGPWPGLVVEWRRDQGGWRARVVYLVGEPDSATTVETWVDAAHLRPA